MYTNTSQITSTLADKTSLNRMRYAFSSIILETFTSLSTQRLSIALITQLVTKVLIFSLCHLTTASMSCTLFGITFSTLNMLTLRDPSILPTGQPLQLTLLLWLKLVQPPLLILQAIRMLTLRCGLKKATISQSPNMIVSQLSKTKIEIDIVPDVALPQWYIDENVIVCQ